MLGSILLLFVTGIVGFFDLLFNLVTWPIPSQVQAAITFMFDKLHTMDFLLPMADLMNAVGAFISFLSIYYTIKIVIWAYHMIRHGSSTTVTTLADGRIMKSETKSTSRRGF